MAAETPFVVPPVGAAGPTGTQGDPVDLGPEALRSSATTNFARVLDHAGVTVALTAPRSGIVAFLRRDGERINTHTRGFDHPTGIAQYKASLALGTATAIWGFTNYPSAANVVDPDGRTDACYIPQECHVSGNIDIHDLAFDAEGVLWGISSRFSCLVNFEKGSSFVPKWRPPFVTGLTGDDRCHLNGLAMVDGRPKYVTAFARTDTAEGWRGQTEPQGSIIDIETGDTIAGGLWFPHSPRWHKGKLWFLESGTGGLCTVDVISGQVTTVATLPGFTRGLAFAGDLAFVGLSRGHAGIPPVPNAHLSESSECGVHVVDTVTGAPMARFVFTGAVEEIYEVTTLAGLVRPDLIEPTDHHLRNIIVVDESFLASDTGWTMSTPASD
jgi:uncharacterized protein (TIGR03032 family)